MEMAGQSGLAANVIGRAEPGREVLNMLWDGPGRGPCSENLIGRAGSRPILWKLTGRAGYRPIILKIDRPGLPTGASP